MLLNSFTRHLILCCVFKNGSCKPAVEVLATYEASNAPTTPAELWVSVCNDFVEVFICFVSAIMGHLHSCCVRVNWPFAVLMSLFDQTSQAQELCDAFLLLLKVSSYDFVTQPLNVYWYILHICVINVAVEVAYMFLCIVRELIGRRQSSWLPEGEAPPPYRGAVGVHRQLPQPLRVQQSFPDLPTFVYRSVLLASKNASLTVFVICNYFQLNFNGLNILFLSLTLTSS